MNQAVVLAAKRAADRRLRKIEEEMLASARRHSAANNYNSDGMVRSMQKLCVDGFREICTVISRTVAEVEGDAATIYEPEVRKLFSAFQLEAFKIFDSYLGNTLARHGTGGTASAMSGVRDELDVVLEGELADFGLGIVDGVSLRNIKGLQVDVSGSNNAVIIGSSNSSQNVAVGLSAGDLLEILADLRKASRSLAPEIRVELDDAILNAERELSSSDPDKSRLGRMLNAVLRVGRDVGVGAAGGILARLGEIWAGLS